MNSNSHRHLSIQCVGWFLALAFLLPNSQQAAPAPSGFQVPPGFKAEIFAKEPMFANPVALSVGSDGTVYVTQTRRRKAANLDIRANTDWIQQELSLRTVEQKRAFYLQELAPENSARNKDRVPDHNGDGSHDWRDLEVLSESIHALKDLNDDGEADRATVFAGQFNEMNTGVAAGVLAWGGDVYATVIPHLWKMTDDDGDGVSNQRTALASGFGVHVAYAGHNMHGLTVGPDGRIYWSIGDVGADVLPNEGAVFRCWPDGSGFEVFARGLRNPTELAFDNYGNLFTGDNDGDFGDRERWTYVVQGGDYGWRVGWQYASGEKWQAPADGYSVWMQEGLWELPFPGQSAHIVPPIAHIAGGPCGMVHYPGTGMGPELNDTFFLAHFTGSAPNSGVHAYRVAPKGAGFDLIQDEVFIEGTVATGVDFGPDGALYVADWGGGYPLNDRGRVHRIYHPARIQQPIVEEVADLLHQGWKKSSQESLLRALEHVDQRVRLGAQFELATRTQQTRRALQELATSPKANLLARVHSLWALGQKKVADEAFWRTLLNDPEEEIRAQAARTSGDLGLASLQMAWVEHLGDPSARVRFFSLEALSKAGNDQALPAVLDLIQRNGNDDLFLRFAGIQCLEKLGSTDALASLASHDAPAVRLAAAVALRRQENPAIGAFLADSDPLVVREAARGINDVPIEEARPMLASLIHLPNQDPIIARRALNAVFRLGGTERAGELARYAHNDSHPDAMRIEALELLRQWATPSPRDRVANLWLPLAPRPVEEARKALAPLLIDILSSTEQVRAKAAETALALQLDLDKKLFLGWLKDPEGSATNQRAALDILGTLQAGELKEAIQLAASSRDTLLQVAGLKWLSQLDPEEGLRRTRAQLKSGERETIQAIFSLLPGFSEKVGRTITKDWLPLLVQGKLDPSLALDVHEGIAPWLIKKERAELDAFDAGLKKKNPLGLGSLALVGGDALQGERLFVERTDLQCLRCHKGPGPRASQGGDVAPNLAPLGQKKDRAYILRAIVAPNADFAEGFEQLIITQKDGTEWNGRLVEETDSTMTLLVPKEVDEEEFALLTPGAPLPTRKVKLVKSTIQSRQRGLSAMPEGFADQLKLMELRDLVEYLATGHP